MADQILDDPLSGMSLKHSEVLGEQTPHDLQEERAQRLRRRGLPYEQRLVESGHNLRGLGRQLLIAVTKKRLLISACKEQQLLVVLRQLIEGEVGSRSRWEPAWFPSRSAGTHTAPHMEVPHGSARRHPNCASSRMPGGDARRA